MKKKSFLSFQATKKTKFLHSHEVSFFTGSKAVDSLLNDSPWAKAKVAEPEKAELVFEGREQCVEYLDELLKHKMFHRAKKIPVRCLQVHYSKATTLYPGLPDFSSHYTKAGENIPNYHNITKWP
jgi:hypothetical protein